MSQQSSEVSFGSDSFLDVMANMVGILIILVTIAVMHASKSRGSSVPPSQPEDLTGLSQQSQSLEQQMQALSGESRRIAQSAADRQSECDRLAVQLAGRRQQVDARRQTLEMRLREKEDLKLSLASTRSALAEIEGEVVRKQASSKATMTIQCYPTPISHSVSGQEIHFRLCGGRIVYVPMEELMAEFGREAKTRVELLQDRPVVNGAIGPEGDFRMRYTLERETLPGGRFKVEATFHFLPVEEDLGETLQTALAPGSEFQEILTKSHARQTTVTLWTYPDSFPMYRAIKKELYGRGFSVAGRPLELGQPIGASTSGTRSAAQ
ncbi:MAG TPA: hypothetical protein VHV55_01675 [Pirellulales bacterium]|jgi:hypothetical protein|nr:hypothetical protein [Pirellulales bacterium]